MRISDWSSDVCSSDLLLAAHEQAAGLVDRPADERRAGFLGDRHRLARDQRLVDRSAAFEDDAIDRDFFARADTQHVANSDVLERDLLVRSEEHTSELQSLMRISYAVFCLKKKTTRQHTHRYDHN